MEPPTPDVRDGATSQEAHPGTIETPPDLAQPSAREIKQAAKKLDLPKFDRNKAAAWLWQVKSIISDRLPNIEYLMDVADGLLHGSWYIRTIQDVNLRTTMIAENKSLHAGIARALDLEQKEHVQIMLKIDQAVLTGDGLHALLIIMQHTTQTKDPQISRRLANALQLSGNQVIRHLEPFFTEFDMHATDAGFGPDEYVGCLTEKLTGSTFNGIVDAFMMLEPNEQTPDKLRRYINRRITVERERMKLAPHQDRDRARLAETDKNADPCSYCKLKTGREFHNHTIENCNRKKRDESATNNPHTAEHQPPRRGAPPNGRPKASWCVWGTECTRTDCKFKHPPADRTRCQRSRGADPGRCSRAALGARGRRQEPQRDAHRARPAEDRQHVEQADPHRASRGLQGEGPQAIEGGRRRPRRRTR